MGVLAGGSAEGRLEFECLGRKVWKNGRGVSHWKRKCPRKSWTIKAIKLHLENVPGFIIIYIFIFLPSQFWTHLSPYICKAWIGLLTALRSNSWLSLHVWLSVTMLMSLQFFFFYVEWCKTNISPLSFFLFSFSFPPRYLQSALI